ncbi:hypothetical protein UH38_10940 [Aliterella atlantica CENA595]|uniref:Uncharacterized protein n=1 Tax=Aliterella atlantica CENA595 TaxID=1618023 RepID=A0A0D8ZTM0_9CYAN|nr:hypothetical protein UH38_10940 [Aliterella atlantica CENA595]
MKFSVKPQTSISKPSPSGSMHLSWELAALGVECLFTDDRLSRRQIAAGNHENLAYIGSGALNQALPNKQRSGRYRHRVAVPI